jgi:hypothetical protein
MIKRFASLAFLSLSLLAARPASAADRDFAVGVSFGSPMGLSVLQNIGESEAVQAAFEYNIYNTWVLQADWLMKKIRWPQAFDEAYGKAYIYYGPGARFEYGGREQAFSGPYRTSEDGRFALRFPAGAQYYIPKVPFDTFAEVAPMLCIWESTTVDLTFALGLRFNL